jgi:hypothetical protein
VFEVPKSAFNIQKVCLNKKKKYSFGKKKKIESMFRARDFCPASQNALRMDIMCQIYQNKKFKESVYLNWIISGLLY